MLALPEPKKLEAARAKGKEDEYCARLVQMQQAFVQRIEALPQPAKADRGVQAVLAFLGADPASRVGARGLAEEVAASNAALAFRLIDDAGMLVSQRPAVAPLVIAAADDADDVDDGDAGRDDPQPTAGLCLVSGDPAPIERLHSAIKGVWGAQTSGANIVSFNLAAFDSYGKARGGNAPVGRPAAFAYTTALNALLARGSPQRLQVADATTVFWAQRGDALEGDLAALIGADLDDPDARTAQVQALFEAIQNGAFDGARGDNRFFVLGLGPNAARIAVRFWHAAPLADIAHRVRDWFADLALERPAFERDEHPALKKLLRALVLDGDLGRLPPGLSGDILAAIFAATPFPALWLNLAVQRCRAEQAVPYHRAAAIKACLNRSIRHCRSSEEEYPAMLDPANTRPAYRLGRLFAVLEKIQEESAGGSLNKTIRERYYGAASSSPASVLPLLLKLKNHHLAKLDDRGQRMLYRAFQDHRPDDYIAQVLAEVAEIPAHLALAEQGHFALGYYHQRQAFFTKTPAAAAPETTDEREPLT